MRRLLNTGEAWEPKNPLCVYGRGAKILGPQTSGLAAGTCDQVHRGSSLKRIQQWYLMLFTYHTDFLYKLGFILLRWFRVSVHTQSCLLHFPKAPDGFSALCLNPDTLEPSPFPSSSRPASSVALGWGPLGQAHRAGLTLHHRSQPPPLPGCAWLLRGQGQTHPPTPTPLYTPAPTHTHTHKPAAQLCVGQVTTRLRMQPTRIQLLCTPPGRGCNTIRLCVCVFSHFSHVWLCDPMGHSLPGSSVHEVFPARILEWVAISFSRGASWPTRGSPHFWCGGCPHRRNEESVSSRTSVFFANPWIKTHCSHAHVPISSGVR